MNGDQSVVKAEMPFNTSKELQRAHTVLHDPFFFIIVLNNPNGELLRVALYLFTDAIEMPLRLTKKYRLGPATTVILRAADELACLPFPINRSNQVLINVVDDKMQHAVNKGAAQRGGYDPKNTQLWDFTSQFPSPPLT